jgi:hypothetical protein
MDPWSEPNEIRYGRETVFSKGTHHDATATTDVRRSARHAWLQRLPQEGDSIKRGLSECMGCAQLIGFARNRGPLRLENERDQIVQRKNKYEF